MTEAKKSQGIEITPEMEDAGIVAYDLWEEREGGYGSDLAAAMFIAMSFAMTGKKTKDEIIDHVHHEFRRLGRLSPMFGEGGGSTP
ncbi:hypothetical protein QFZ34_002041 [Phyllobacterium ifriqiyense]|uniref:Uncharacterized protein n=1 Tax=Phyllobacterium ifriqiyense TaxID=314238 RepID=A0ABU0S7X0_9HYPH|nr:hypothetical protein [Phyllobacterium ifriqiyense]MDQ0996859.1 hypothetical protein [Phyllobacterium ifriqiyense]